MSFSSYNNYKASGLDWLPCVPAQWNLRKISWHLPYVVGWTPPSGDEKYYDGDYPWVTIADMTNGSVSETQSKITAKAVEERNASIVPAGSMLFSFKLSVGKVAFLEVPAYTNEAIAAFLVNEHVDLGFWKYAAPEIVPMYGRKNIYGALLLNQDLIGSVRFYCPSLKEQKKIAEFLDHETAKIDALITEQQRLIELLREKRQAVISHAVTKGLNPDTPMKDSGVEWLGEVPAHWEVSSLKRYWSVLDCKHVTAEFIDEGFPLASIREVQSRYVDLVNAKQTTRAYYELLIGEGRKPKAGDLIISRNATVGEIAEVADWHPPFAMGQDVCLLRRNEESLSSAFLYHVFKSEVVVKQIEALLIGSTFKRINVEQVRHLVIPMPPRDEQARIAEFIEQESERWSALVAEAKRAIDLLRERRSALIAAAVTGKIDVREWVSSEPRQSSFRKMQAGPVGVPA